MPHPQFSLRSLFILTALVALGCLVGPPIVRPVVHAVREWFRPIMPPRLVRTPQQTEELMRELNARPSASPPTE
jgi:hypothetical protein